MTNFYCPPDLASKLLFRLEIVEEAKTWIGTPYRHQASVKDVGADCLGLLRGVWRKFFGEEPWTIEPYSPDWAEAIGEDRLLQELRMYFEEIPQGQAQPGDILVFRMATGAIAKHVAILSDTGRIIHAYWGKAVTATKLVPWWERRICAAFRFPVDAPRAPVAELVDAPDSKSGSARSDGSSPSGGTNCAKCDGTGFKDHAGYCMEPCEDCNQRGCVTEAVYKPIGK